MDVEGTINGESLNGSESADVIRGKAMFLYFSFDPTLDRPFPHAITAARWDRIGQIIR